MQWRRYWLAHEPPVHAIRKSSLKIEPPVSPPRIPLPIVSLFLVAGRNSRLVAVIAKKLSFYFRHPQTVVLQEATEDTHVFVMQKWGTMLIVAHHNDIN